MAATSAARGNRPTIWVRAQVQRLWDQRLGFVRVHAADRAQVGNPAAPGGDVKFSTDPQLEAKLRDEVGLYLDPPAGAVVVSVDEKSQIQALDRAQPMLAAAPRHSRAADPRLHSPRHHQPVRRAGGRHRQGHRRRLLPASHQRRVSGLSQAGRQGPPPRAAVRHLRQLRHREVRDDLAQTQLQAIDHMTKKYQDEVDSK